MLWQDHLNPHPQIYQKSMNHLWTKFSLSQWYPKRGKGQYHRGSCFSTKHVKKRRGKEKTRCRVWSEGIWEASCALVKQSFKNNDKPKRKTSAVIIDKNLRYLCMKYDSNNNEDNDWQDCTGCPRSGTTPCVFQMKMLRFVLIVINISLQMIQLNKRLIKFVPI